RSALKEHEGDIAIIVESGEELGDIKIALQYEGEKGKHKQCLSEQGSLLVEASVWLKDIYSEFDGYFTVEMVSHPCPHGDSRLLRIIEVEPAITRGTSCQVETKR